MGPLEDGDIEAVLLKEPGRGQADDASPDDCYLGHDVASAGRRVGPGAHQEERASRMESIASRSTLSPSGAASETRCARATTSSR